MSEPLDWPPYSYVKHILGHGPNTTPSLYKSSPFDMRHDGGRWFPRVFFINDGDGTSWVFCPVSSVDHVLPAPLMVPIFLCYLIKSQMKLIGCPTMCVIVAQKVTCCNVCSLLYTHNWTSHNEMASTPTFIAEVCFRGRGQGGGERRHWRTRLDGLKGIGSITSVFFLDKYY